ncbi:Pyridoxal phosphate biosynthetic protein PdxA [Burkholderia sp. D7]|nr:Pyridoxal phosphate biosynthetic protein PdxA [Burkholderia sp. D7]
MSIASSKTIVKRARAVLVTGAARRIGRGLALGFAQRGWDVAVHYSESAREAGNVVRDIAGLGRRAVALAADPGVEEQVRRLVPACVEFFGDLDCVLNCASRFDEDTAKDFGYAKFLETNGYVTVIAGTPIIRTTAGHGTAYDIVGKGVAKSDVMTRAILLAADLARLRNEEVAAPSAGQVLSD